MRKLFVSVDLEGCGAVASQNANFPDRWEWGAARRWMTQAVIAVAEPAFAAGYDEVIVADGHGNGHNVDPDLLPDNVQLIRSWPRPLLMMEGVNHEHVDACALIGYHGRANAQGSLLAHSFSGAALRGVRVNGEICSEGYLSAALAGEYGRPVLLISGDQHTLADARRYAPESELFLAKHSIGYRSAMSLPPAQVHRQLREAATRALSRPFPKPFMLPGPYELELEMTTQSAAEMLGYIPGVERTGAWTVTTRFQRLDSLMRFITFVILYSPSGQIPF